MAGLSIGKFVSDRAIAEVFYRSDEKMCSYGAWHWLLSEAAFKDHPINYKGRHIEIKRGVIPTSYRCLAKKFGWSVGRVTRFVKNAEVGGHIRTSVDTGFLTITICNYNDIQKFKSTEGTVKSTYMETPENTIEDTRADTNRTKETKETNKKRVKKQKLSKVPYWKSLQKESMNQAAYKSWIEPLNYKNGYVECPNPKSLDWCRTNYEKEIQSAIQSSGTVFRGFKVVD
jgi:hypothetical protein